MAWIVHSMLGNVIAAGIVIVVLSLFLGRRLLSRNGIIAMMALTGLVVGGGAIYRSLNVFKGPGFVFYEGSAASQGKICSIGAAPAVVSLQNHNCPNDEIRSVKLLKLKKNTILRVFDHPDGQLEDDWAEVVVLKDLDEYVVSSFEAARNDGVVEVYYSRNNGLDGKISRLEVAQGSGGSPRSSIALYEGDNLTQNKVCEVPLALPTELNFKNDAECDNDEVRSALLRNVQANTRIRLYDDPGGNRKDDWLDIIVLKTVTELRVPTLEMNDVRPTHRIQYHRNDGLQGKVSRLEAHAGGPEPLIVLYEGNGGSQNIVCTINVSSDIRRKVTELGCANDEARSAILYNLPKRKSIRLFDGPEFSQSDDWSEIVVQRPIVKATVQTFGRNAETQDFTVHAHRQNGLDGKVSAIQVASSPFASVIDLFEGPNGSQNRVCSIAVRGEVALKFTSNSNGHCANDEARSMILHRVPAGTVIRIYDHPDGKREDDWSEIEVVQQRDITTVPSFQTPIASGPVRLRYFRNNGLDGKVSRLEMGPASSVASVLSFYEGNNASQNKVCDLEARASGKINFRNHGQCDNDEARSVRITNVPAGYTFTVFDDPGCGTGDDWTQIQVTQDIASATVRSFQNNVNNGGLRVHYNRKNGLDGKVSCIRFGQ
jgi:hypothetical protein